MRPRQLVLLLFLVVVGTFYFLEYTPTTYVWNNDPELVQQIAPPLRTILTLHLLLLGGLSLAGLGALARPSRRQQWVFLLLLGGGWVLAEHLLQSHLAVAYYAAWKYEFKTEEYSEPVPPVINADVLTLLLHDVRSAGESVRMRSKLALMLGEARVQAGYPALIALARDPHQNPYLRFHCLKSLRRLRPQQFAAVLATVPADSALMLYRKYQLPKTHLLRLSPPAAAR